MQVFKAAHKKIVEIRVSIRNKPSISQTDMTTWNHYLFRLNWKANYFSELAPVPVSEAWVADGLDQGDVLLELFHFGFSL